MKIRVMQKHIDAARLLMETQVLAINERCPIALAIAEAGFDSPEVYVDYVLFIDGGLSPDQETVSLPTRAQRFIENFDHLRPVKPFTFEI